MALLTAPLLAAERPNVVLFVVDDMGWMDSSAYGSEYYETPHMERLAKLSMRFTDAYAVPLCSPSRASILSGQYSARHGVTTASGHQPPAGPGAPQYPESAAPSVQFLYPISKNYLAPAIVTLAEVLRDAGYATGHFGKWHLGLMPQHWPEQHGFETTWHCAPDPGPPSYFSPYGVAAEGRPGGRIHVGNITDGEDGEYITDRLTDEAVAFLEAHRDAPFYLNLWQYGVHGPWGHQEEYTTEFAGKTDPRGEQRNPIMASMLKSVDQSLGRILDKLDELRLTDNTLFVFYSDNGGNVHSNTPTDGKRGRIKPGHPKYEFVLDWKKWAGDEPPTNNAPLRGGKASIYEGGQRVPLMVRWPGRIAEGTTSEAVVGAIDLYPTVLAALGVGLPADHMVDGISFLPVLEGMGKELEREAYFTWFPHLIPGVSVRSGDFKLIRRWEPKGEAVALRELYDLGKDIGETTNLAETMPDKVAELDALIDRFLADTGALVPKPNPAWQESAARAAQAPWAGLVPKQCSMEMVDGALRVVGTARNPFLGSAQIKGEGPLTVSIRARGQGGGARIQWSTTDQESFPETGQSVDYVLPGGEAWHEVEVSLPVSGTARIVRFYLPVTKDGVVDLKAIEVRDGSGVIRSWQFGEG